MAVYRVAPLSTARAAAARMNGGVSKSGSPAPRSITWRPAARSAFARAETAIVADAFRKAMFSDGRKPPAGESVTEARRWLEWEAVRRYTLLCGE